MQIRALLFLGFYFLIFAIQTDQPMSSKKIDNQSLPDFNQQPHIDKVGVEERVSRFQKRSIKNDAKLQGLKMILNIEFNFQGNKVIITGDGC